MAAAGVPSDSAVTDPSRGWLATLIDQGKALCVSAKGTTLGALAAAAFELLREMLKDPGKIEGLVRPAIEHYLKTSAGTFGAALVNSVGLSVLVQKAHDVLLTAPPEAERAIVSLNGVLLFTPALLERPVTPDSASSTSSSAHSSPVQPPAARTSTPISVTNEVSKIQSKAGAARRSLTALLESLDLPRPEAPAAAPAAPAAAPRLTELRTSIDAILARTSRLSAQIATMMIVHGVVGSGELTFEQARAYLNKPRPFDAYLKDLSLLRRAIGWLLLYLVIEPIMRLAIQGNGMNKGAIHNIFEALKKAATDQQRWRSVVNHLYDIVGTTAHEMGAIGKELKSGSSLARDDLMVDRLRALHERKNIDKDVIGSGFVNWAVESADIRSNLPVIGGVVDWALRRVITAVVRKRDPLGQLTTALQDRSRTHQNTLILQTLRSLNELLAIGFTELVEAYGEDHAEEDLVDVALAESFTTRERADHRAASDHLLDNLAWATAKTDAELAQADTKGILARFLPIEGVVKDVVGAVSEKLAELLLKRFEDEKWNLEAEEALTKLMLELFTAQTQADSGNLAAVEAEKVVDSGRKIARYAIGQEQDPATIEQKKNIPQIWAQQWVEKTKGIFSFAVPSLSGESDEEISSAIEQLAVQMGSALQSIEQRAFQLDRKAPNGAFVDSEKIAALELLTAAFDSVAEHLQTTLPSLVDDDLPHLQQLRAQTAEAAAHIATVRAFSVGSAPLALHFAGPQEEITAATAALNALCTELNAVPAQESAIAALQVDIRSALAIQTQLAGITSLASLAALEQEIVTNTFNRETISSGAYSAEIKAAPALYEHDGDLKTALLGIATRERAIREQCTRSLRTVTTRLRSKAPADTALIADMATYQETVQRRAAALDVRKTAAHAAFTHGQSALEAQLNRYADSLTPQIADVRRSIADKESLVRTAIAEAHQHLSRLTAPVIYSIDVAQIPQLQALILNALQPLVEGHLERAGVLVSDRIFLSECVVALGHRLFGRPATII